MVNSAVFLGPTLPEDQARRFGPVTVQPPVAVGDLYRAVDAGFDSLLIVDGVFHRVPAVQHREIVYALSRGVRVYGAASMGALRAAELCELGMIGVGNIFRAYRDGSYTDDDEVAVAHGDFSDGYRPMSTPMVTIRAVLSSALQADVIRPETAETLTNLGKRSFYPDRHWPVMFDAALQAGASPEEIDTLAVFARNAKIDPKRDDAVEALHLLASPRPSGPDLAAVPPVFEPTDSWLAVLADEAGYKQEDHDHDQS